MKNNKLLFLLTLIYFGIGFINIHFALLGFVCMLTPLILLIKYKRNVWCQGYCPRASLYTTCGKATNKFSLNTPTFFIRGKMKWIMLIYFGISLLFITASTIGVSMGKPPMDYLRFLLIFPLKWMPQLITITSSDWLLHLSYRFYSMMMTTTILGLIMALVYKPRTWCLVCPIATVSDVYLDKTTNKGL